MKPSTDGHLTRDQMVLATVDPNDLPEDRRVHLQTCDRCRQILAEAQASLDRLGSQVRLHTPIPSHPIRIDHGMKRTRSIRFGLPAGLSAAVVAIMTIAIIWTTMNGRVATLPESDSGLDGVAEDSVFMEEVARLVENPLPDRYRNLIGVDTTNLEGDFMEYIVPTVTHQPSTTRL